jgi:hypothetical protein
MLAYIRKPFIWGLIALLALTLFPLSAQARPDALAAGDIAVIGYNIDEPTSDGGITSPNFAVTIVALADISAGEVIKITDQGWRTSTGAFTSNTTTNGIITWTPTATVPAGTAIKIQVRRIGGTTTEVTSPGTSYAAQMTWTGWTTTGTAVSNVNGGALLLYQGTSTFIYGFTNEAAVAGAAGTWETNDPLPADTIQSNLPPGLTEADGSNAGTAHAMTGTGLHFDNLVYTGPTSGTKNSLLLEIGKDSNWIGSETIIQDISIGGTYFPSNTPTSFTINTEPCVSTGSTSWSTPATWSCNHVPNGTEQVTITSGHTVSLSGNVTQDGPIVLAGNIDTGGHVFTLGAAATLSGAGDIIGTTRRSSPTTGAALFFNNVPTTFNFTTAPTQMDVQLTKSQHPQANYAGGGALMLPRYYTLTPTGSATATVCLGYQDSELGSITESDLRLCRWTGSGWSCPNRSESSSTTSNTVCADSVSQFSDWTLGAVGPTALALRGFAARPYASQVWIMALSGLVLAVGALLLVRRIRH